MSAHRRLIPLRGTSAATLRAAEQLLATLDPAQVLWVGTGPGAGPAAVSPPSVRKLLGRAFDAVVVDLHEDVSPDLLGQVHGFIWGGGALVLRLPSEGEQPSALGRNLVVKPYGPSDVGTRFWRRLEQWLPAVSEPEVLSPQRHAPAATDEQDEVVRTLDEAWARSTPARHALLADRGRGKSSALGRAIASLGAEVRVAVASMNEAAAAEVLRFAADRAGTPARGLWRSPAELLRAAGTFDVIVVDEAAQVPVPTLQRIVRAHPDAHLAFATTARGYEGTGRGFVLRFLAWLEQQPLPVTTVRLHGPIRWSRTDRLEAQVFSLLALDAGPSEDLGRGTIEAARLDRDALASDEALLRQVFGLLVHAHYRTTPADLHRLLDAPNLEVHALLRESSVLGVALLAREGRLAPDTVESMYAGGVRLRGQALAETLIRHSGRPEVGPWTLVRSVRTAVHPALRGRGLGRQLVEHVHRSLGPDVDAIGTLFGATAELVRFRHAGGYLPVRLGSSRGGRTGEPSVVMLRPLSVQARETTSELRAIFARDLPGGVALAAAEGVPLEADLLAQLRRDLPEPRPLEEGEIRRLVRAYAYRGGTHEVSALALRELVDADPAVLDALTPVERRLIVSRVLRGQAWDDVADSAGLADARVAMRALRRAVRAFLETKERISAGDQSAT